MSARRFTAAQESDIAIEYQGGKSLKRLANEHGTNTTTIANVLRRQKCARRRGGPSQLWFSPELGAEVKRRYEAGESQERIATAIGHSQPVVGRYLRLQGIWTKKNAARRERHWKWTGGRIPAGSGYMAVLVDDDDPFRSMAWADGHVLEHRLVMARHLGRALRPDESVHHKNGNKLDNRLENLQLINGRNHGPGHTYQCADCGSYNVHPANFDK